MNPNDETQKTPYTQIHEYALTVSTAMTRLLSPYADGRLGLSDDSCDDFRSMADAIDLCSRAMTADDSEAASALLIRSFTSNDPRILHAEMPLTFDPFDNAPYFTWAMYFSCDCPTFCDFPDAD